MRRAFDPNKPPPEVFNRLYADAAATRERRAEVVRSAREERDERERQEVARPRRVAPAPVIAETIHRLSTDAREMQRAAAARRTAMADAMRIAKAEMEANPRLAASFEGQPRALRRHVRQVAKEIAARRRATIRADHTPVVSSAKVLYNGMVIGVNERPGTASPKPARPWV